jgi:hypothetical protein
VAQTVELPADLADALSGEAAKAGLSLSEYAVRLLATVHSPAEVVRTGSELVAYWQAEGVIGSRPDLPDSQEYARQLRDRAQRRGG